MKNKKLFCIILTLVLCFSIVACSKTSGSATSANAQTNFQEDNSGTMVAQSSKTGSGNSQSKRYIDEKYRGDFTQKEIVFEDDFIVWRFRFKESTAKHEMVLFYGGEEFIPEIEDDSEGFFAYTVGNELFFASEDWHGGEGQANAYSILGTFTDTNTFSVKSENAVFFGGTGDKRSGLYKRQ